MQHQAENSPCKGRIFTPNSSRHPTAWIRSSSSWMAAGLSVISCKQHLREIRYIFLKEEVIHVWLSCLSIFSNVKSNTCIKKLLHSNQVLGWIVSVILLNPHNKPMWQANVITCFIREPKLHVRKVKWFAQGHNDSRQWHHVVKQEVLILCLGLLSLLTPKVMIVLERI